MASGEAGAKMAFQNIFGSVGGSLIFVFVIISCLGTLNGLMVGCTRGLYSLAARNKGPLPEIFKQVDKVTNMPTNSQFWSLLCALALYFMVPICLVGPFVLILQHPSTLYGHIFLTFLL